MISQEKKSLSFVIILLCVVVGLVVIVQWLLVCDLYMPPLTVQLRLHKLFEKPMMFRLLYIVLILVASFLFPKQRRVDDTQKGIYVATTVILSIGLLLGFSKLFPFYNLFFFPIVFIGFTIIVPFTFAFFMKRSVKSDDSIFGVSNEKSNFYFELMTELGPMTIHRPQQNIYIDGGPGSGKSESWIKGIIYQCAQRGYAGFIYDWEGDPTKENSPILSRIAYGSVKHFQKLGNTPPEFAFINFTDMSRTMRVNVLSEKYMPKGNESLFIRNLATTLMKNLEPAWKEKTDFWASNAINFVSSLAYKCYKHRDMNINTLPHVIAFAMSDTDLVFKWLEEDAEIALNMSAMFTSWRMGAQQQTAGVVSSAQIPLVLLNNKNIFWVLSPLPEEEFSLDITNRKNPKLLCVGNAPSIKEATSPAISCIASIVMSQMNNPGKAKSVFLVDEFPTFLLQGIDTFLGTARKHYVATILALQDFNQAILNYGEKPAGIVRTACGTQAFGMTGNDKTAKDLESLLGEKKIAQDSFSHQDSGEGSRTESLQKEKVMFARDIAGQPVGHFIGKIAGGKPPYFNVQMKMCEFVEEEIPRFSVTIKIGEGKEDLELSILDDIVEHNYIQIINTVNNILLGVKQKVDAESTEKSHKPKTSRKKWKKTN